MAAKCINLEKETAAMLTEDLISEILVRLPVKSVMRCRCVCKAWLHLIKSPNFIETHLNRSKTKTDLILLFRNFDLKEDILSIHAYESFDLITKLTLDPSFKIADPCNGLVCLLDVADQLELCNPSTGKYINLPPSAIALRTGFIQCFGFGFVSNTNDYKVVSIISLYEDNAGDDDDNDNEHNVDNQDGEDETGNKVEIYDLSTDSWRQIECDCPYTFLGDEHGTLFNRALHWTAEKEGIDIIPSFNLSTEVFRDIELPNDLLGKNGINKCLTIIYDSLALFAYTNNLYNSEEQFVEIWVMKEYGVAKSWTKQFSIGPLSGINGPLMLWKNKAILLESMERQLLSCDLDTHEIEEFEIQCNRGSMRAMVYQESLVSFD